VDPKDCLNLCEVTCYECVFVTLVIQHAMLLQYIVICGLPGCKIFFHIIS